ncbi:MAG TPA: hypothetical protein VMZ53_01985 [Kofleriaceae bacterium]|nr:hypothetical protein [Kofleriaceae bacterium]
MPRVSKAAMKPGTERYRDERRNDPKPKMHGKQWHDHAENPVEGTQGSAYGSSVKGPVRDGGETTGLGKTKRGTKGAQRKRMTPVSKGRTGERAKAKAGAGRNVKTGMKVKGRRTRA